MKGFALYKMRMFERAMKELDFVNTLAPTEFMPYHLKASCLHQLGKKLVSSFLFKKKSKFIIQLN